MKDDPKLAPKPSRLKVGLDDVERKKLERIAKRWGVTLSAAIKRLIREAK